MNEDVFAASPCSEEKTPHPSVQELTEQIHRLLMQVSATLGMLYYTSLRVRPGGPSVDSVIGLRATKCPQVFLALESSVYEP